jgi:hypothetical protein
MADKKYRIDFEMTDGTVDSVEFVVPQGEKGEDGTSVTITSVNESTEEGGANVVTFSDGNTLSIKNGEDGDDFTTNETLTLEDGVLSVNTTDIVEADNTLPITSAGVDIQVGNIEVLLKTI